ncbi:alpha/beta hydrolase [Dactylosporangium matsuzakiense]|nr:alpha/beta hydrolase [Dactylosporangium matsuzakiense]
MAAPADAAGFTSRRQQVGGLWLHIRERVSVRPERTACLLLHGLAVSHRYLMPTARRLQQRRVYVPDLPGFGRSGKPGAVLDAAGHADVLATWLDAEECGPVAVLGNSFGGQVAVQLAWRRPDLVAGLILVGPTTDPAAASMTGQLWRLLRDLPREDPRQAPILAADLRDAGLKRVVSTLRLAVRDPIAPKLATLRVPTLLARGSRDPIAPSRWLGHLAALLPGAQTLVLAGAAHNAVTTAGAELATAVDEFIETSSRPAPMATQPRSQ